MRPPTRVRYPTMYDVGRKIHALDVLLAPVHWLYLLGLTLWVGSLTMLLHVLRGPRVRPEDIALLEGARRRSSVVALWSVVALLITLVIEVGAGALAAAGGDVGAAFNAPALRSLLFGSRVGVASVARWLLLVAALWAAGEVGRAPTAARTPRQGPARGRRALGIVAPAWRRSGALLSRGAWLMVSAVLAAGVLLCTAVAGPYGVAQATAAVEALHLAATVLWLGGTIMLVVAVAPYIPLVEGARRPLAVLTLLNRFTPIALLGLVTLVATGAWEATHAAGIGPRLGAGGSGRASTLATLAGLSLMAKTLLLIAIVVVSARSLLGWRRRLQQVALRARRDPALSARRDLLLRLVQRAMRVNAGLAVMALLCGAIADLYPQQALAAAAAQGGASVAVGHAGGPGGTTVLMRALPAGDGQSDIDLYLGDAGGEPVDGVVVTIAARSPEARGPTPPTVRATRLGPGHYRGRLPLHAGGRWTIVVGVGGGSKAPTATFALTIPPPVPTVALAAIGAAKGTAGARGARGARRARGARGWQGLGPVLIAHALVAAPDDRSRLYEGTIEGVYRSDDGGARWVASSDGFPQEAREVWSLTFLPDRSLVAATGGGLYRSTDGARHWRSAGLGTRAIYTLAAHVAGHIALLAGGDGGVYRSDDGGARWRQIYDAGSASVTSLAWPSVRPALIVAGVNPGRDARGARPVVVSEDGGASWTARAGGLSRDASVLSVAVAPGARIVYIGSLNDGAYVAPVARADASWQGRGGGLPPAAQVGSFAFDPANPAILYAATTSGVYRSGDAGARWVLFGEGLAGDATVVGALDLVNGPHPVLYAATAAGLYRHSLG